MAASHKSFFLWQGNFRGKSGAGLVLCWVRVDGRQPLRRLRFNTLLYPRLIMAWLELDASGNYHVSFRMGERRYKRSLKTSQKRDAERLASRLEENLTLVERGRLTIPDGADIPRFL